VLFNKLIFVLFMFPFSIAAVSAIEHDPTKPPLFSNYTQQAVHSPLTLSLVMKREGAWRAIINEQVVSVNDRIGSARVMMIDEDQVVLSRSGERIILQMSLGDIRRDGEYEEAF